MEAALLLKPTGPLLAWWTRSPVGRVGDGDAHSVVPVMAATLVRSIDALVESFGGACPLVSTVEANDHILFVTRIDGHRILLLVGRMEAGRDHLRRVSHELVRALIAEAAERASKPARLAAQA